LLGELGCKIVAVSNKYGSVSDGNGLDVHRLLEYYMKHGDGGLKQYATDFGVSTSHRLEVLRVPTDIFIPAGPVDVLAVADELEDIKERDNDEVLDVADFRAATGVSLIVEGANHPFSPRAEQWLESEGVRVLPDYIVNCGGLIGCWVEWEARHARASQSVPDLRELAPAALDRVAAIVTENVREIVASGVSSRDAAEQIVARNRVKLLAGRR
jgi:glutamate dehydrogenase/leucine dehydrogenase